MNKLIALSASLLLASTAFAGDWSFYGSARVSTFGETILDTGDAETPITTKYGLQPNSRFGGKVQDGDVGGVFEAGAKNGAIVLRKVYGTYSMTPDLSLLIGQDYSPVDYENNNQVWGNDNDLGGQGSITDGRVPQMKLMGYGVKLALMNGLQTEIEVSDELAYKKRTGNKPKVAMSYEKSIGDLKVGGGASYNMYTLDADGNVGEDYKDSYTIQNLVAALDLGLTAGMIKVNTSWGYAINGGELGFGDTFFDATIDADGKVQNVSSIMGYARVSAAVHPKLTPEIGAGFVNHSLDGNTDTKITVYGQVAFAPAKNVVFVPEAGISMETFTPDEGDAIDAPSLLYYGMKSQISF